MRRINTIDLIFNALIIDWLIYKEWLNIKNMQIDLFLKMNFIKLFHILIFFLKTNIVETINDKIIKNEH